MKPACPRSHAPPPSATSRPAPNSSGHLFGLNEHEGRGLEIERKRAGNRRKAVERGPDGIGDPRGDLGRDRYAGGAGDGADLLLGGSGHVGFAPSCSWLFAGRTAAKPTTSAQPAQYGRRTLARRAASRYFVSSAKAPFQSSGGGFA